MAGSKKVTLTAAMSGGKGDVAWQHTQLMRTGKEDADNAVRLRIVIKLQKSDI